MRRATTVVLFAAALIPAAPLGNGPAAAGVTKHVVVGCPSGPSDCWPVSFDFLPGGRGLLYVERYTGEIRRFLFDGNRDSRWTRIGNLSTDGEQGLLGIALDPRWARGRDVQWVYVFYTQRDPLANVIVRMRKRNDGSLVRDTLARIPAASAIHNGGVIHFGPDGMLYAVTGEAHQPARAQDRDDNAGKVLRMTKEGHRPQSNPFAGSLAWSYGHRNSFGFTFDRRTGRLWQTENGPECEDEVNLIRPGRNYGWGPASSCPGTSESGPNPVQPKRRFTPTIAITGAAFCFRCGLGTGVGGDLLVGSWKEDVIRHFSMRRHRSALGAPSVLFSNDEGVIGVEAGPGGTIYFSDPHGIYRLRR